MIKCWRWLRLRNRFWHSPSHSHTSPLKKKKLTFVQAGFCIQWRFHHVLCLELEKKLTVQIKDSFNTNTWVEFIGSEWSLGPTIRQVCNCFLQLLRVRQCTDYMWLSTFATTWLKRIVIMNIEKWIWHGVLYQKVAQDSETNLLATVLALDVVLLVFYSFWYK